MFSERILNTLQVTVSGIQGNQSVFWVNKLSNAKQKPNANVANLSNYYFNIKISIYPFSKNKEKKRFALYD